MFLLSIVSVTHAQSWFKNIKWDIPGINKLNTILNRMIKSHAMLLLSTQIVNHSFVQ